MPYLNKVYNTPPTLLTDFYQFTMAYAYWKEKKSEQQAVFTVFFRKNPFRGGYTVAAGLEQVIEFIESFSFLDEDLSYLESLETPDGQGHFFETGFLKYLKNLKLSVSVEAVPEGTLVFPHEPLLRIRGPILQCQLLETAILNIINFQTLIATKAARLTEVTQGAPVLEFGLRRAQGFDGALSASRAAFLGGCTATSNTLAGKLFDIPVCGTHAHSWIMAFGEELESFFAFAKALPGNSIFLVDTYNTLEGVRKAIKAGEWLRSQGKKFMGIRIDSGDLAYLSTEARRLLDAAGFQDTKIIASNDLNEDVIESLMKQGAQIGVWGVGTQLVTAFNDPALGGVYKLTALQNCETGKFEHRIKVSEQSSKTSTPGQLQVRRFRDNGQFVADMIYDELTLFPSEAPGIIDPCDPTHFRTISKNLEFEDLLKPIFDKGKCVYQSPTLEEIQTFCRNQKKALHDSNKRLLNPHRYVVGLEKTLHQFKMDLIWQHRTQKFYQDL